MASSVPICSGCVKQMAGFLAAHRIMDCRDRRGGHAGNTFRYNALQRTLIRKRCFEQRAGAQSRLPAMFRGAHNRAYVVTVMPPVGLGQTRRTLRQIKASTTCFSPQQAHVPLSINTVICCVQEPRLLESVSPEVSIPTQRFDHVTMTSGTLTDSKLHPIFATLCSCANFVSHA